MTRSDGVTERHIRKLVFTKSKQVAKKPNKDGEAPVLSGTARSCYH